MSLDAKNQKCAVCSAYLFADDDIVYCPVCGAPHHRDCYATLGKCGLENYHGTDMEYRREAVAEEEKKPENTNPADTSFKKVCRGCGMPLNEGSHFCNNCGMPVNMNTSFGSSPFEPIPLRPDTPISDGVTAGEAAEIVRTNTFRYLPKFLKLDSQNKGSWNWAAFLLPHAWFAFRKMYKESIITTLLMIITVIMNFPLTVALAQLPLPDESIRNYVQLGQYYAQFIGEVGALPIIISFVGLAISLVVRIVCGIYGDYIYKQRVTLSASLIKEAEDTDAAKRKYSGTSFIGFFLAVLALELIPSLLSTFLL